MIKLIAVILLSSVTLAGAAVPSRLKNGKVELAVAKVGPVICWTQAEKTAMVNTFDAFKSTSPYVVQDYTPNDLEVALKDSNIKYRNHSDYTKSRDNKGYLEDRLDDLKPSIQRKNSSSINQLKTENNKR